jgi:N-acetylneuraminic acid mutarotase
VLVAAIAASPLAACGSTARSGSPASGGENASGAAGGQATTGAQAAIGGSSVAGASAGGTSASGNSGSASVPDAGEPALTDPEPGAYGERAELPASNSEMAVAELDGKIYVLGGYPSTRQVQNTVQVYDPALDSWDSSVPLPLPLHHPVVVGVGGRLLSFGGQLADAGGSAGDEATARVLALDPSAASLGWVDLKPMPTARGGGAAAVIGTLVYVVGGRPPAGNAFEVFDTASGNWTALEDLPQTLPDRNHLAAAAIGGKVYVAGGRYMGGGFSSPLTDSLDVYDPAVPRWSQVEPMLRPRGGINGVALFGCFFVWGGEGANTGLLFDVFPQHDVYNPMTDSWTALDDLPTPIHGVSGAAAFDGLIYMPGGGTMQGGNSGSTIFQVYRPDIRCE